MNMSARRSSVLVVSHSRLAQLERCLRGLARQDVPPTEVIVVWQADDHPTRELAERLASELPCPVRVLHCPERGIVPAENVGLQAATGEIILLIDDDAVAPADWVARHLAHYDNPRVGAVGGPADNHDASGARYPRRAVEPVGRLTWYGRALGNMYDQDDSWRTRPPRDVDHLVGYNLSLRRAAFDRFEDGLKPYWQQFELEACLQVKSAGYRVLFDFGNVVDHYPTNTVYQATRDGDLTIKVDHSAFNSAFNLAKHSAGWQRPWRLLYLLLIGTTGIPGLAAFPLAVRRYGQPRRELSVLLRSWRFTLAGWRAGTEARHRAPKREPRPPSWRVVESWRTATFWSAATS